MALEWYEEKNGCTNAESNNNDAESIGGLKNDSMEIEALIVFHTPGKNVICNEYTQ